MANQAEITWSDEEAMLAYSAAELLGKRTSFDAVRAAMATEHGYDRGLYRELCELGWLGVAVPAAYEGAEMRVGALTGIFEAAGQRVLGSPLLASTLAAQALLAAGSDAQNRELLTPVVRGEAIATVALSEPSGSWELRSLRAAAKEVSGGYALTGTKTFVLDGQNADLVLVAAQLAGRPALFALRREQLADRLRPERLIDETRRSARLSLDGLRVDKDALLDGNGPDATAALAHVQRTGWLLLAAEMAGGTEGVLQLTVDYLKTRKQFGKLIGSYQALKHPTTEIMCSLEQGRALLYHAATAFDREDPARELALRMAKAQLGDGYAHATDRAIQFHGAIGFTWECHAQLFFRRAQWAQYTFGDGAHHRRHLAELLLGPIKPA
jgi:alkylation response protein AidB-like acyl-CoA dehydrogenase